MVLDVCDSSDLTRICDDDGATKRSQFHIMQFCLGVTVSSRARCVIRPHAIAGVRAQGGPVSECRVRSFSLTPFLGAMANRLGHQPRVDVDKHIPSYEQRNWQEDAG
jgi:hypothetical protein